MAKKMKPKLGSEEKLQADLKRYCQMAIDAGAVEAQVIEASDIVQEMRTRLKCFFPKCTSFGSTVWCPPDADTGWEQAKAIVNSYQYAIIWRVPAKLKFQTGIAGMHLFLEKYRRYLSPDAINYWEDFVKNQPEHEEHKSGPIVEFLEKQARKDGHYFATTFAYGNCSSRLCGGAYQTRCIGIKTGLCRFPGKSRPDGVGALYINMLATNAKLGWRNLNVGWSTFPEDFPPDTEYYLRTSMLLIE